MSAKDAALAAEDVDEAEAEDMLALNLAVSALYLVNAAEVREP